MSGEPKDPFSEFSIDEEVLKEFQGGDTPGAGTSGPKPNGLDVDGWPDPDIGVLRLRRRPPPPLPLEVFGEIWGPWIVDAAAAAACPPDYVIMPLLSSVSVLIGHARWAQATPGWREPPHLWGVVVGDSGDGKSPGADCLMRDVLPEIERRMLGDYPERLREWQQATAFDKAALRRWEEELRAAQKAGDPALIPPMPESTVSDIAPERPRLRQHDVTIEQIAALLATAAPKGAIIVRDEIAGWLMGMNAYNPAGRQFWNEAYGGRPHSVERRKHSAAPIVVPRLAVAVCGGTQPQRLAELMGGVDDGLLARIQWSWPDPILFRLGQETPRAAWAIEALDRLRELDLQAGEVPVPISTSLTSEGRELLAEFGREMQARQVDAGGLMRSAFGKARGTALRLSLVFEWLWWCAKDGLALPPSEITPTAFAAAATLVADYFMPMAERVFGDAGASDVERNAATLARWIVKEHPSEVYVRHMQRTVRLPGLRSAEQIKKAADALVEADWLRAPAKSVVGQPRSRVAYTVNSRLKELGL